jgi:hypothetical protein
MATAPRPIVERLPVESNGGPLTPELKAVLRRLWTEILIADLRDHPIDETDETEGAS